MTDKKEYPLIRTYCNNSYYAGILQNLYAGSEGEVVIFLQFRYHSYILNRFNSELSEVLGKIAADDLKHQELLAQAIQMTSGDPLYHSAEGKWIGGRQIDYVKDTKQILSLNLESKEKSVIDYKLAISKIENSQIKALLSCILTDEENHRKKLKALLLEI